MDEDSRDKLGDLADAVAEAFDRYRDPSEFKTISLVIDDSSRDHRTLIVHVDGEGAPSLADDIESFLQARGAATEREVHLKRSRRMPLS